MESEQGTAQTKPMQPMGEPAAPERGRVLERLRLLKWNEVVSPDDFVLDDHLRLQQWEGIQKFFDK
jgi:hypothetical protein